ncbi:DUF1127 domain-containing protein [Acuticoccus sediminis]|uniref:DUF1127 domain-containing protein n=1 Tax=Acuticoccus sediminis TaxID=2184697 RepID=UPI001CFC9693|nr:DUF1127 domain-containing protein [Acuticoccus sediminis]
MSDHIADAPSFTTHVRARRAAVARLGGLIGAVLWRFAAALVRIRQRRETLRALRHLDDAALRDIGVTRSELPHETLYALPSPAVRSLERWGR